jgi:mono/diheme cytochrome c family protein
MDSEKPRLRSVRFPFEVLVVAAAVLIFAAAAVDAAMGAEPTSPQAVEREVIPGADKMTPTERETYRRRMAAAATPEEKARIRAEYAGAAAAKPEPAAKLVGDPARGAELHRGCFGCHGIERYTAPVTRVMATLADSVLRASGLSDMPPAEPTRFKGRVQSLAQLREGVRRRNDYLNPKMTAQEVEDVVAYLNQTYYKFPTEAPDVSAAR